MRETRERSGAMAGSSSTLPVDRINMATRTHLLQDVEQRLRARQGFALATLNLDHVVKLVRDPRFQAAYDAQDIVVADGNPLVWLRRLAGKPVELIPGSELVAPLAALAARTGVPVALLGSRAEVLEAAAARLEADHPGLRIVTRIAPPMGYDPDGEAAAADLARIAGDGAGLCFLALGAPKQERLAARGRKIAPRTGFVSVGAGLDFIAGHQQRAPRWVQRMALEWLWRMALNPRRMAGRYVACALVLPGLMIRSYASGRRGEVS